MTQQQIETFIAALENVQREENMGYIFFFVGDNHFVPFVSIAQKDNEGDNVSKLDRGGIYRINIGVPKETFDSLFANISSEQTIDYTTLDLFMPHPHYAKQFYICILNPSSKNEDLVKKYILEAHGLAKRRLEMGHS
jgi:hypothetical protein